MTFCWLLWLNLLRCPLHEVRAHSWANGLREQAASFIQSHCLNKTIAFLKSHSATASTRASPLTQESMEENPFQNKRWGFLENIGHLRTVEDDTRDRTVTQRAVCLSGRPHPECCSHDTKTNSTTVCTSREVMWLESCDWSHVTGDGRLPQASMLITLTDLRCGFTELDSALKLDLLVRKCEDYLSLDQLKQQCHYRMSQHVNQSTRDRHARMRGRLERTQVCVIAPSKRQNNKS